METNDTKLNHTERTKIRIRTKQNNVEDFFRKVHELPENLPRYLWLLPTLWLRSIVVKLKGRRAVTTQHNMRIEFLASFAQKTLDERCALGGE